MGRCILPDYIPVEHYGPINTRYECERLGGRWEENSTPCFVREVLTRSLGETILELGTTFQFAVDFRDQILVTAPRGKYFLDNYYAYLPKTFAAARENYSLVGSFIEVWLSILPFVQGVLEANGAGEYSGKTEYADSVRFSDKAYNRIIDVISGFQKSSTDEDYIRLLHEVASELEGYIGLTPYEALERIRRS